MEYLILKGGIYGCRGISDRSVSLAHCKADPTMRYREICPMRVHELIEADHEVILVRLIDKSNT